MTFGSLFSGCGGMDLGLERAGLRCVWQCEIDPFARKVLAKHWPGIPCYEDVKTFPPNDPEDWAVDLICGGFPCQDISYAGKGAGLEGKRSGLWYQFARVVRELRPRYVLVENVGALSVRGLDAVLGTLASLGFDAEWSDLPACALGAPHPRRRVFIVAHANGLDGEKWLGPFGEMREEAVQAGDLRESRGRWMDAISGADRNADGVPNRVDRVRTLGNSASPTVVEWIGRRIMEAAR